MWPRLERRLQVGIGPVLQQYLDEAMQAVYGGDVHGCLALGVAVVCDSAVMHQKHGRSLVALQRRAVQQGVARAGVDCVHVGAPLDEARCEGVVEFPDVAAGEVGGVQLLQRQPQGGRASVVAEVKVQPGQAYGDRYEVIRSAIKFSGQVSRTLLSCPVLLNSHRVCQENGEDLFVLALQGSL